MRCERCDGPRSPTYRGTETMTSTIPEQVPAAVPICVACVGGGTDPARGICLRCHGTRIDPDPAAPTGISLTS